MKIRLETNSLKEVERFDLLLTKANFAFTKSKIYPNRGSDFFRIYYEFDLPEVITVAAEIFINDNDDSPADGDAVLGGKQP